MAQTILTVRCFRLFRRPAAILIVWSYISWNHWVAKLYLGLKDLVYNIEINAKNYAKKFQVKKDLIEKPFLPSSSIDLSVFWNWKHLPSSPSLSEFISLSLRKDQIRTDCFRTLHENLFCVKVWRVHSSWTPWRPAMYSKRAAATRNERDDSFCYITLLSCILNIKHECLKEKNMKQQSEYSPQNSQGNVFTDYTVSIRYPDRDLLTWTAGNHDEVLLFLYA